MNDGDQEKERSEELKWNKFTIYFHINATPTTTRGILRVGKNFNFIVFFRKRKNLRLTVVEKNAMRKLMGLNLLWHIIGAEMSISINYHDKICECLLSNKRGTGLKIDCNDKFISNNFVFSGSTEFQKKINKRFSKCIKEFLRDF